jgi:hypothetical protein
LEKTSAINFADLLDIKSSKKLKQLIADKFTGFHLKNASNIDKLQVESYIRKKT